MKKLLFTFVMSMVFISIGPYVFASRTLFGTNQICDITGTIRSVARKEAYNDPCVKDHSCPAGAYNPKRPEAYELKILLSSVSCEPDKSNISNSYQSQFSAGKEVTAYINKSSIHEGDTFAAGQKISGKIKYFFGHSFVSYTLEKSSRENINIDKTNTQNNITDHKTEKTKPQDSFLKRFWKWFLSLFLK